MRSGKENGISFPVTPGTSGQVLVSNGNGVISWSSALSNAVTLDGTQTISGTKTFSAQTTTVGSAGQDVKVTSPGNSLTFESTGTGRTSRFSLVNMGGAQGIMVEQVGNDDLVDFIYKASSGQGNVRYERRTSKLFATANSYEFQMGPSDDPDLVVGFDTTVVRSTTLKVGDSVVYHAGNIPGSTGQILSNGSGITAATKAVIENGYIKLLTGMPNASGTGGTVLGAKDLGGRITPAFVGPAGVDATLQTHLGRNRIAQLVPVIGATAPTAIGQTVTATGTATARSLSNASFFGSLPRVGYVGSGGVTGSVSGFRTNLQWWRGSITNAGGFFYSCTFALTNAAAQASGRAFVGLYNSTSQSTNTEVTNFTNAIGMARSTVSNNWMFYGSNGTANSTLIDLGSNFPAGTVSSDFYRLTMFAPPSGTTVGWRVERLNAIDGSTGQPFATSGTITNSAQMPANNVFLAAYGWSSTGTLAGTAGIDLINLYVETDN